MQIQVFDVSAGAFGFLARFGFAVSSCAASVVRSTEFSFSFASGAGALFPFFDATAETLAPVLDNARLARGMGTTTLY